MVSNQLQQLAQLARMQKNPSQPDWGAVRAAIGFAPPEDYCELIEHYGAGLFNCYIQVHGPEANQRAFNLKQEGLYWDEFFRSEWERRPDTVPSRLHGRTFTIICWGGTEDAVEFFWIAEPDKPSNQWEIAFQTISGNVWEFYRQSTVEVLLGLARGDLSTSLIPPALPDEPVVYAPYIDL
ncbi:hypothetical protein [Glycomyces arizonensis]|uniref:hypothetical protein n=1 Tax=Glycomyces arizonensis TaxID=256035 RepID=UPI000478AC95|nr:hypothetical protein [Glycomyces arizonensis]